MTSTPAAGACPFCARGYFTAEYSRSEGKTNYYCNNCFRYLNTEEPPEEALLRLTVEESRVWGIWTDKEVDELLDTIFNDYED